MWSAVAIFGGIWSAAVSAPLGWIIGARVGDARGIIGYLMGGSALLAGVAAALALG